MRSENRKFRYGITLAEVVITMVIAVTLTFAVGVLLVGGQRAWKNTYASAHKKIKEDALTITVTFGSMGRRSNREHKPTDLLHSGYVLYKINGGNFTPATPDPTKPDPQPVFGDAVEFRYWDVELDKTDSHKLLDVTKIATAYALFYLDIAGKKLKVDYGPYPPGAVPAGGTIRNTVGVRTIVLAENVSLAAGSSGAFSHTTEGGKGKGSVRINVNLKDPNDNETIKVMTSTMLRNIWPR